MNEKKQPTKKEMARDTSTLLGRVDIARLINRSEPMVKVIIDNDDTFPPAVPGQKPEKWRLSDIIAWDNARIEARRYIADDGTPTSTHLRQVNKTTDGRPIYRVPDMAAAAGVADGTFRARVRAGLVPAPVDDPKTPWDYWEQDAYDQVKNQHKDFPYRVSDMAAAAKVTTVTWNMWVRKGRGPAPGYTVGKERYWSKKAHRWAKQQNGMLRFNYEEK